MGKSILPSDFHVTEDMRSWARIHTPSLDVDAVTSEFRDYWVGHGKQMADWNATWRNWLRKAKADPRFQRQRARAPDPLPQAPKGPELDKWEAAGNSHLLKHIRIRMQRGPHRYGEPGCLLAGSYLKEPGKSFKERVLKLVQAKKDWEKDMRDLDKGQGVPTALQKDIWTDYIRKAEAA